MKCLCMAHHTMATMMMRGFTFHPFLCRLLISGHGVFIFNGLVKEFIMEICQFYELNCVWGEGYWFLVLVWGSNYALDVKSRFYLALAWCVCTNAF
jgi:hypothetical protein